MKGKAQGGPIQLKDLLGQLIRLPSHLEIPDGKANFYISARGKMTDPQIKFNIKIPTNIFHVKIVVGMV